MNNSYQWKVNVFSSSSILDGKPEILETLQLRRRRTTEMLALSDHYCHATNLDSPIHKCPPNLPKFTIL